MKPNPAQTRQAGGLQGIAGSSWCQTLHLRQSLQPQTRSEDRPHKDADAHGGVPPSCIKWGCTSFTLGVGNPCPAHVYT